MASSPAEKYYVSLLASGCGSEEQRWLDFAVFDKKEEAEKLKRTVLKSLVSAIVAQEKEEGRVATPDQIGAEMGERVRVSTQKSSDKIIGEDKPS